MRNLFLLITCLSFIACQNQTSTAENSTTYLKITGPTMGTTYNVTYASTANYQVAIDSLLKAINDEVSTYIPNSTISLFGTNNTSLDLIPSKIPHFCKNIDASMDIFQQSNGYFDPTVMPLVNYWGFGYTEKKAVSQADSVAIDSILQFVGMDKLQKKVNSNTQITTITKTASNLQLDFSAIAKGYGVDAVAELLNEAGVTDYLVEIGGETVAKGKNPNGKYWTLGINTPKGDAAITDFQAIVQLPNKALATSGNYRNFFEVDGVKYAHTINPKTGFPEKNTLLSASIFANNCMTADGYATACMVMGLQKAFEMISSTKDVEGYFIYGDEDGTMNIKMTDGVSEFLK